MGTNRLGCRICGAAALEEIVEFSALPRVTSDCIPFPPGGKVAVCSECAAAQAVADAQWFAEIGEIYDQYEIYHQSGGIEQHVIDPRAGTLRLRSEVLLDRLFELDSVPPSGDVLDFGCGNGGTLRAFAARGRWNLYGLEMDDRNLSSLERIPGFVRLFKGGVRDLPRHFDLITMVHALEHFPEPYEVLAEIRSKLCSGGRLFIEVPNAAANPFDYAVADHMMHFSSETLVQLLKRSGFALDCMATNWVTKELSAVARVEQDEAATPLLKARSSLRVRQQIAWLQALVADVRESVASTSSFGLFGTSIAATWLWQAVRDRVDFFVEEDIHRTGRIYLGRPVLLPEEAPIGAVVYLALIPKIASTVHDRLRHLPVRFRLPPSLTSEA